MGYPSGPMPSAPVPATAPQKPDLLGLAPPRLVELCRRAGFSPRRARNLFQRLHEDPATPLAELQGVNRGLRQHAAEAFRLHGLRPSGEHTQPEDGHTRKLLFTTSDGLPVETVLMPRRTTGFTVCVSSQVGCRVGCTFCRTGEMGLLRNLTAGEIVDQVRQARALVGDGVKNVVFMGMGEPLENLDAVVDAVLVLRAPEVYAISQRRITLSTSGHLPGLVELGRRLPKVNLAVSLNAPDDARRDQIMPINRRYPLAALLAALRAYPLPSAGTIMIEYVLLAGFNDAPDDARALALLLEGLPVKLNLIRYNPVPGQPFQRPDDDRVAAFREALGRVGEGVLMRYSWGGGIAAACGQLGAAVLAARGPEPAGIAPPLPWSSVDV